MAEVKMEVQRGAPGQEAGRGGNPIEGKGRQEPVCPDGAAGWGRRDQSSMVQGFTGLGETLEFVLKANRKSGGCRGNCPMDPGLHTLCHAALDVLP